jgi:hypothetical protein
MHHDELRRVPRVSVCCRVVVRERNGIWTAVTYDIGARGCGIVTTRLPRLGSRLAMTLSSDLFPEELDVVAETVWATAKRLGVMFLDAFAPRGALSPREWLERVLEHGRAPGVAQLAPRAIPTIQRVEARPSLVRIREAAAWAAAIAPDERPVWVTRGGPDGPHTLAHGAGPAGLGPSGSW